MYNQHRCTYLQQSAVTAGNDDGVGVLGLQDLDKLLYLTFILRLETHDVSHVGQMERLTCHKATIICHQIIKHLLNHTFVVPILTPL